MQVVKLKEASAVNPSDPAGNKDSVGKLRETCQAGVMRMFLHMENAAQNRVQRCTVFFGLDNAGLWLLGMSNMSVPPTKLVMRLGSNAVGSFFSIARRTTWFCSFSAVTGVFSSWLQIESKRSR
ncbi:hypothetical protein EON67_03565, partial [archaeon]